MKIEMQVKIIKTGMVFKEEYDIDNSQNPLEYAQSLINNFNNTLRPNESARELLEVKVIDKDCKPSIMHNWEKQNLVTIMGRNGSYDNVKCVNCGVTAKRYGLTNIVRDSKYNAKIYDTCDTAIKQLNKLQQRRKNK